MRKRGCFPTTTPALRRRPCRSRHPYAVSKTSLRCVCIQRRNCIEQSSPSHVYAPRSAHFPVGTMPQSRVQRAATAASFDSRADFETAWRVFLAKGTPMIFGRGAITAIGLSANMRRGRQVDACLPDVLVARVRRRDHRAPAASPKDPARCRGVRCAAPEGVAVENENCRMNRNIPRISYS